VRPYEQGEYSEKPATYSLPVRDKEGKVVGILGLDISLRWLSEFINSTKPYPNSYCSIIGRQGGYIVHPDSTKMSRRTVFELINGPQRDTKMEMLLESMMSGQSGYKEVDVDDVPSYVFYKPFRHKGWVATIVCPESDIMDGTSRLLQTALIIVIGGLLVLLLFCIFFIERHIRPLSLLAETARRLSEGHYDDFVPDTRRVDEIGSLQKSFKVMQQSIASRIDDIRQMNSQLEESNAALQKASQQAQQAERAMNTFLHNISDQMLQPVINIKDIVSEAHKDLRHLDHQEASELAKKIHTETDIVTELLDRLLVVAGKEGGEV
jgi:methyl-accepting chemotaxis protein/sigma-B regulation protein RsbU (phosphoserine phosphatase)